ncbi:MAG: tetratricopeptide repeat protein [Akkermansia sp.]|nr:tetratricopeptide repeat protein [Akkermansia sp.]
MKPLSHLFIALLAAPAALADAATASQLLREGRPADAIDALRAEESPEAAFWRGRALIELGRLQAAATELRKVPGTHELYPYAAKGLLYCAWKSNRVDFAVTATPMATCANEEIAALATAALAEHWLSQPKSQDNTALERLRSLAPTHPELRPLLRILEVENLRLRGEFDKAIELCRELENDRELSPIMRQRVRLSLSEVYYAKEEAGSKAAPAPESPLPLIGKEAPPEHYDDGKGEETLLHFISSHPESPLLEEAFRRLHVRGAFEKSEYARTKLREWSAEPLKSRRAAMALLIQQHLLNPEGATDIPLDVTCANTAAATCPNEPATRILLLEQTRRFLERKQTHEALLYLGMIPGNDVHKQFYETQLHDPDNAATAAAYLQCARIAPESLRPATLANALLCALKSGDTATQEAVLNQQDITDAQRYTLLLTRAGYWLSTEPEKARHDIETLRSLPAPNANLQADVEMDLIYLTLLQDPQEARKMLQRSELPGKLTTLSDERQLRFFALQEELLRRLTPQNPGPHIINLIRSAANKVLSPRVLSVLNLHLASLQSAQGEHADARHTLNTLIKKYPKGDFTPRALYMSARESEYIGTQQALQRAIRLYTTCAERSEELAVKATIRRAEVMMRLGQHEESEYLIVQLSRRHPDMRAEDKLMANAVLANNKALLGTKEGRNEAVEISARSLENTRLPRWWRFRALLHHASLCSRADMHERALKAYEECLSMEPAKECAPSPAAWHILYTAGAGAVMQLLYLERFAEAADKADSIANWNQEAAAPEKRKQFSDWAAFIRQTNFVNIL